MCYCTPSIRTPFCGKPGCGFRSSTTIAESKDKDKTIIDIVFALDSKDIIQLIQGNEYQLYNYNYPGYLIRVKVLSKERKRIIDWQDWTEIKKHAFQNPELMKIIEEIEQNE